MSNAYQMTPDKGIDAINTALAEGDEDRALKLVVQARDHLAEMLDLNDSGSDAWLLRSRKISDQRFDVLLAALIENEFDRRGRRPKPEWTACVQLGEPWTLANERRGPTWTRRHTPEWLAERGVFVSEHDLMTA